MARIAQSRFNDGIYIGSAVSEKHYPKTSWWMKAESREQFYQMAEREQDRMMLSRYGQMKSPTFGPADPKAGLLHARYAKAPGVEPESE